MTRNDGSCVHGPQTKFKTMASAVAKYAEDQELFLKDESIVFKQGEQSQLQLQMSELLANKGIVLGYDSKTRSCTIAKIFADSRHLLSETSFSA